jgi:hypothetical protein
MARWRVADHRDISRPPRGSVTTGEREREREGAAVSDRGDRTPVKRRREGGGFRRRRLTGGNGTFVRKLERERERAALEGK